MKDLIKTFVWGTVFSICGTLFADFYCERCNIEHKGNKCPFETLGLTDEAILNDDDYNSDDEKELIRQIKQRRLKHHQQSILSICNSFSRISNTEDFFQVLEALKERGKALNIPIEDNASLLSQENKAKPDSKTSSNRKAPDNSPFDDISKSNAFTDKSATHFESNGTSSQNPSMPSEEDIINAKRTQPTFSLVFDKDSLEPILLINGKKDSRITGSYVNTIDNEVFFFESKENSIRDSITYTPASISVISESKNVTFDNNANVLKINGKTVQGFSMAKGSNRFYAKPSSSKNETNKSDQIKISLLFQAGSPDEPILLIDGEPAKDFILKNKSRYTIGSSYTFEHSRSGTIVFDPPVIKFFALNLLILDGKSIQGFSANHVDKLSIHSGSNANQPDCTFEFGGAVMVDSQTLPQNNYVEETSMPQASSMKNNINGMFSSGGNDNSFSKNTSSPSFSFGAAQPSAGGLFGNATSQNNDGGSIFTFSAAPQPSSGMFSFGRNDNNNSLRSPSTHEHENREFILIK